jgi:hypothetical protein
MVLERDPLSLVNTIEELLGRKIRGSSLENQEYGCRVLNTQTLALTLPTSGGRSVGIVHSRTQVTEFCLVLFF